MTTEEQKLQAAASPVREPQPARLQDGTALCLSGGGFRAMLFHVGSLWRLNELGCLHGLHAVSSVSGGSITAGVLAMNWNKLNFDAAGVATNFDEQLVDPVRGLAARTIDVGAVLRGLFLPGTISEHVAAAYRKRLFKREKLSGLPDTPRFVFNATSVQTGALWRFSKAYMADYKVGMVMEPEVELAVAVAASSAFPPVLSPLRLKIEESAWSAENRGTLHEPPYTTRAVLTDGGVYDNLGIETAWKGYRTVLVSDGGGQMEPEPSPHHDWIRHALRVNKLIDNQVRDLRKRQIVAGYLRHERKGTYFGIRGHVADYGPPAGALPAPPDQTLRLAQTPTRLAELPAVLQERLINWGYTICDAGMRTWVTKAAPPPTGFPYPEARLG